MEKEGDWSCDANDALHITVIQPGEQKPKTLYAFHPRFTYPIFGDDERIFGYQGLIIRLRFAAHDLRSHVHISYDDKFKEIGDTVALDLNKTLKDWIPESAFTLLPEFEKVIQNDTAAKDFTPPGKLMHSYIAKGRNFEIWAGSLGDPHVRHLLERAQIFVSLFIEAGTPIVTDDPEWTLERWFVYFVYEKVAPPTPSASQYSIVGYATTYRWWLYPKKDPSETPTAKDGPFPCPDDIRFSELPSRLRIAQFLILPPHQGSGHGIHLYTAIHSASVKDSTVVELTVEDPNEAFDALRDTADYHILRPEFLKQNVNINPNPYSSGSTKRRPRLMPTSALIPIKALHDIRCLYKIAPTQFAHILEMFLLSRIPFKNRAIGGANMARLVIKKHKAEDENDRRYYWWRMLVKQRLYKRSRDMLIQLDLSDRIQKLDETLTNVEEGYEALLKAFVAREENNTIKDQGGEEERVDPKKTSMSQRTANGVRNKDRLKRKLTVVEDDSDEDMDLESEVNKRPKV